MTRPPPLRLRKRRVALVVLLAWVTTAFWQVNKPMPAGTDLLTASVQVPVTDLNFLHDLTYLDSQGKRHSEQEIFDAVFKLIDEAHSFIVADFFLFNDSMGATSAAHRALSSELAERLLARKAAIPGMRIVLITDPVNEIYGGTRMPALERLRRGGVDVVTTGLDELRDSNPSYSAFWRLFVQWWGNAADSGFMPNPFGGTPQRVSLRSWLAMLNFKANHRKLIVTDRADGSVQSLVMSANPHDASSAHSNVALQMSGPLALQIASNELAVAGFSGWKGQMSFEQSIAASVPVSNAAAQVTFLTEAAIRGQLLEQIDATNAGDSVRLAMFYLAQREIIDALLRAAGRGVRVQLILDPNKDAFGRQKDGVPNRPVAHELVRKSNGRIEVRWYQTSGEQFHTKLTLISRDQRLFASLGSANLTRRNVDNYNLEANVALDLGSDAELAREMTNYFARLWSNEGGEYTVPFARFDDASRLRYWRYRAMEATGLSTF
ncbi:MAG: phospholipase D-like domain-containing protein [Steroidobacteraceae bacterium]